MDSFKTGFARTKQKLMSKTGSADETIDVQYHYEKEKVFGVEERLLKIQKNSKKIIDLYKELEKTMTDISADACDLYEATDFLFTPASQVKEVASSIEEARQRYDERMGEAFHKPLADFISQHKEIKKRTEELTTRKTDMDRYKGETQKLREKATSSSSKTKIAPTEEKFAHCKEGYESLHEELVRDLPLLYDDRNAYFTYLVAALAKSQDDFYKIPQSSSSVNVRDDPAFKDNASIKTKSTPEYSTSSGPLTKDIKSTPRHDTSDLGTVVSPNPAFQHSNHAPGQMTATALYDFAGVDSTELSFKSGDQIRIFKNEGEWWEGEINGQRGLVPANYVKL
eukprot:gene8401-9882_t